MTEEELTEIEELEAAASKGPWWVDVTELPLVGVVGYDLIVGNDLFVAQACDDGLDPQDIANARFIAKARNILPKLIARVRELEKLLEE